ncbi:MAG: hypothetical protein EA409_00860 [Saprospirales bacterium]|nr:MAG: hypothetical protein EA409_00860 [Saprospirales bacterium]
MSEGLQSLLVVVCQEKILMQVENLPGSGEIESQGMFWRSLKPLMIVETRNFYFAFSLSEA